MTQSQHQQATAVDAHRYIPNHNPPSQPLPTILPNPLITLPDIHATQPSFSILLLNPPHNPPHNPLPQPSHSARFVEIEKTIASLSASFSGGGGGGSQPPSPRTLLAPLERSPSLSNLNHHSGHQSSLGISSRTPSPSSRSQSPLNVPLPLAKATGGGAVPSGQPLVGNNNINHNNALASIARTPSLERSLRSPLSS